MAPDSVLSEVAALEAAQEVAAEVLVEAPVEHPPRAAPSSFAVPQRCRPPQRLDVLAELGPVLEAEVVRL